MFHPIDLKTWPRAQMYWYFSQIASTGYSLTTTLDVTKFYALVKKNGFKFFPSYLWLVTRNLMKQQEFCCAVQDGVLGYFDDLTPLYASFHEDDHTFSLMWTAFNTNFKEFHQAYRENKRNYGSNHGVVSQPQTPPPSNAYTVSALPWISFDHFAVHSYEKKSYFFPSLEAGKMFEKEGRLLMPLSLTCHHATTDGWHVSQFLESLQLEMNEFSTFIEGAGS